MLPPGLGGTALQKSARDLARPVILLRPRRESRQPNLGELVPRVHGLEFSIPRFLRKDRRRVERSLAERLDEMQRAQREADDDVRRAERPDDASRALLGIDFVDAARDLGPP